MEPVAIVAALALLEYMYFVFRAGQARGRHGIPAPAMSGNSDFERSLRVQGNTLEQLVVFVPGIFLCAHFASEALAVVLGLVFVVGRALYAHAYVTDPGRRGPGFLMTIAANLILVLSALAGAAVALF